MSTTFYAVCNVNGPISVELGASTKEEALDEFSRADTGEWIDEPRTDIEEALGFDGYDMSEDEFAEMLTKKGLKMVEDLETYTNYYSGRIYHIADGWVLWSLQNA